MLTLLARSSFPLAALALILTSACGADDQNSIDIDEQALDEASNVSSFAGEPQEQSSANSSDSVVNDEDDPSLTCSVTLMYCVDPTKGVPTFCYSGCSFKSAWATAYDKCVAAGCGGNACANKLECKKASCAC